MVDRNVEAVRAKLTPQLVGVVTMAARNAEFVTNWARLRGVTLPCTPIERLIDETSGHGAAIARQFIDDVAELFVGRMTEADDHGR